MLVIASTVDLTFQCGSERVSLGANKDFPSSGSQDSLDHYAGGLFRQDEVPSRLLATSIGKIVFELGIGQELDLEWS